MAVSRANPLDRLDPELSLRPGEFDAQAVLFLWCIRKSFYPTIWLGLSVAFIGFGDVDTLAANIETFDSPQAMVGAILSPLGVLVAALVIRIVGSWLALAAAYPLTRGTTRDHYRQGNRMTRWFHFWRDRLYQARAYRSLRLTWGVRKVAYDRLDDAGRFYRVCEFVLVWANIVLFITLFIVIGIVGVNASAN